MRRTITCLIFIVGVTTTLLACSKSGDPISVVGKYRGSVKKTTFDPRAAVAVKVEDYEMSCEIVNGDSTGKIKFNFKDIVTSGTLTGNTFSLNRTLYTPPFQIVYGNGEFKRDKMDLNYRQLWIYNTDSVVYMGQLTKMN